MVLRCVFGCLILAMSANTFADALDINLNNNAAQFKYGSNAGVFIQGNSEFHVGVLYNDVNNTMGEAGLIVKGDDENLSGLSYGVGARAVIGSIKNIVTPTNNVQAIAIGGEVGFALPTAKRVAIVGEYFAGPKITTFGDAERYNQSEVRLEFEIIPQTKAYLGYREINFGIKSTGGAMLDKGTYAGLKISL